MTSKRTRKPIIFLTVLLVLIQIFSVGTAFASYTIDDKVPWEGNLKKIADSMSGPVAFSLGLLMIVCGFCAVAFTGADMSGWVRWVAVAAILLGMLAAAPKVLVLFGFDSLMIG